MPKRKREDDHEESNESENEIPDRSIKIGASRLKAKTAQSTKKLHDALKLARGFERQKLGRRQKSATKKKDEKDLERLKVEVAALKALDLTVTAKTHLFKQYTRTKRIHESPVFQAAYGKDVKVEGPKDAAQANVLGRLFNSNPVKQAMPEILSSILHVLGLEDFSDVKGAGREKAAKGTNSIKPNASAGRHGQAQDDEHLEDEEEFNGFSDDDTKPDQGPAVEDGDEHSDDMDLDQFNDRLASSSDSEADDAHIPDLQVPPKTNGTKLDEPYSKARDISLSPSPSPSLSQSPSPPPPAQTKSKRKDAATKPPPSTTTFLPSLTMGGYFSGSESDPDDDFSKYNPDDDPTLAKPRKNRRGQRARQLINERKYGKNAKHLVKQREEAGWDPRRGAVYGKNRPNYDRKDARKGDSDRKPWKTGGEAGNGASFGGPRRGGMPRGRGPQTSGANEEGLGRDRKFGAKDAEPTARLHPSWEAAKRKKEESKAGKFEGKKITFD